MGAALSCSNLPAEDNSLTIAKGNARWWHNAVCYEVYIRSFNDSKGTGIGDLKGIENKLDYLKNLGVDVIWITPFYPSPGVDMGYDISDYKNVDPKFGQLKDFDSLVKSAHAKGIKILVDMVFSHTSDEHQWFIEARKSKDNPYHDFYVWYPPKADGSAPNDWKSWFSGSAWEYNKPTNEYYLHIFAKQQPALNWKTTKVREELFSVAKFWLDKGADGIRFDVITLNALPDINQSSDLWGKMPMALIYLKMMNDKVLSEYDILTVGEMPGVDPENAYEFVGEKEGPLKTLFQLDIMGLGNDGDKFHPTPYSLVAFKKIYQNWYNGLYGKGWISAVLDNHDQARAVSRWGNDKDYWKPSAKMLATFLLTQWGVPYVFQGDEIGMTNCPFTPAEFKDVEEINYYKEKIAEGKTEAELLPGILARCRDNARTPMQWSSAKNAGFTSADTPWIKVNPNYKTINVEAELKDPDSILNYYKKMISLRKANPAFVYGTVNIIDFNNENVYAYSREYEGKEFLVVCNFRGTHTDFDTKTADLRKAKLLIHNYSSNPHINDSKISLKPFEAMIFEVK
ncbi:MAG TPA: glucohydrolase [Lentisphaeria bacterium]|nr:glucohydrolase [Lentisphaeria bacterium]